MLVGLILPIVYVWARRREAAILRAGDRLSTHAIADAVRIGVLHPERVRTLVVATVPPRWPRPLSAFAARFGFGPKTTAGMALGHGIYLRADQQDRRELLAHELAHTAQYERLGFRNFLREYLRQCLTAGYSLAELEAEARQAASKLT